MRKFMNNVAVKWNGVIVFINEYDYRTSTYTIEDKSGCKLQGVKEEELKRVCD